MLIATLALAPKITSVAIYFKRERNQNNYKRHLISIPFQLNQPKRSSIIIVVNIISWLRGKVNIHHPYFFKHRVPKLRYIL